jgi:hypothetical protein
MIWKPWLRAANILSALLLAWMHFRGPGRGHSAKDLGDGRVEFSPDPLTYFAWPLITLLPAWVTINELRRGLGDWSRLMAPAIILLLAVSEMFSFPGSIVVSHEGIDQHFWLRGQKRIRWGEVTEIREGRANSSLSITASDGTRIDFTGRLPGLPRFLAEIGKYCRGNLPPEFLSRVAASAQVSQRSR